MSRREFLQSAALIGGTLMTGALGDLHATPQQARKVIPSSGQSIAALGLGSWQTFDVDPAAGDFASLPALMARFLELGGELIDSSPMYGRAEEAIGQAAARLPAHLAGRLFAATKVWTDGRPAGIQQMEQSFALMHVKTMHLMQIHNLRDWRTHLPVLRDWQAQGRIRHNGVTTSHGMRHPEMLSILRSERMDFAQFTYNIADREAEKDLLPLCQEKGVAVLANRPFREGSLFKAVRVKKVPDWAAEFGCQSWAQFLLKFVISHPGVTCVIPATSKMTHLEDDMRAGLGRLPDAKERARMAALFANL